jgi:hypothetical protein
VGPAITLSSQNRIYYRNQYFFEPDVSLSEHFFARNLDDDLLYLNQKSHGNNFEIEVPLLIGKGRIEQVQDARLAIYILDELQKKGRIARIPGEKDILAFASLISGIKNERFFDSRICKIAEIEKVDSFLQANALITVSDAAYFTTVNYNWDFSSGPVRKSGKRISAGIVPEFDNTYS